MKNISGNKDTEFQQNNQGLETDTLALDLEVENLFKAKIWGESYVEPTQEMNKKNRLAHRYSSTEAEYKERWVRIAREERAGLLKDKINELIEFCKQFEGSRNDFEEEILKKIKDLSLRAKLEVIDSCASYLQKNSKDSNNSALIIKSLNLIRIRINPPVLFVGKGDGDDEVLILNLEERLSKMSFGNKLLELSEMLDENLFHDLVRYFDLIMNDSATLDIIKSIPYIMSNLAGVAININRCVSFVDSGVEVFGDMPRDEYIRCNNLLILSNLIQITTHLVNLDCASESNERVQNLLFQADLSYYYYLFDIPVANPKRKENLAEAKKANNIDMIILTLDKLKNQPVQNLNDLKVAISNSGSDYDKLCLEYRTKPTQGFESYFEGLPKDQIFIKNFGNLISIISSYARIPVYNQNFEVMNRVLNLNWIANNKFELFSSRKVDLQSFSKYDRNFRLYDWDNFADSLLNFLSSVFNINELYNLSSSEKTKMFELRSDIQQIAKVRFSVNKKNGGGFSDNSDINNAEARVERLLTNLGQITATNPEEVIHQVLTVVYNY